MQLRECAFYILLSFLYYYYHHYYFTVDIFLTVRPPINQIRSVQSTSLESISTDLSLSLPLSSVAAAVATASHVSRTRSSLCARQDQSRHLFLFLGGKKTSKMQLSKRRGKKIRRPETRQDEMR
ncbi:unnamed protein product [Periconia digitata]|uniref:Uncharacterized protein n=1 Tax=Periconia digitata TaxID=1303443 RepID=A0A9W4U1X9_9PLEO|nr:unnamed protein product [Periconia digitata]